MGKLGKLQTFGSSHTLGAKEDFPCEQLGKDLNAFEREESTGTSVPGGAGLVPFGEWRSWSLWATHGLTCISTVSVL